MTLVAGIGNLFFGDDGFGVEVARELSRQPPAEATVTDFGIRALHLAYELCYEHSLCIVADCVSRGGSPGTLYVIEPDVDGPRGDLADAHGMNLEIVFTTVAMLGGVLPKILIVGCEPEQIEPGIGLSASVQRAIPAAASLIRDLLIRQLGKESS
ncbi:MAG TPA: hydrogenase maturation protease [Kofleriaceae bacterium]|jgi:hydrogenase maturation protease|nr:hydrogenase maturation protease [Kofleriaceae bacterium]